eukprot:Clim_evm9s35 gene=Clim_evmTU9s35
MATCHGEPDARMGVVLEIMKASLPVLCSIMGAGILGIPMALAAFGWYGGFVLAFAALLQTLTSLLIVDLLIAQGKYASYHNSTRSLPGVVASPGPETMQTAYGATDEDKPLVAITRVSGEFTELADGIAGVQHPNNRTSVTDRRVQNGDGIVNGHSRTSVGVDSTGAEESRQSILSDTMIAASPLYIETARLVSSPPPIECDSECDLEYQQRHLHHQEHQRLLHTHTSDSADGRFHVHANGDVCEISECHRAVTSFEKRHMRDGVPDGQAMTYADLGFHIAGDWGRRAVLACQLTTCYGDAVLYLVGSGQNISRILGHVFPVLTPTHYSIICCFIVMWPAMYRDMGKLSYVSLGGVAACALAALFITLIEYTSPPLAEPDSFMAEGTEPQLGSDNMTGLAQDTSMTMESQDPIQTWQWIPAEMKPATMLLGFATIMFSYGPQPILPAVAKSMRRPHLLKWSVLVAVAISTALYMWLGVVSYYMLGCRLTGNILEDVRMTPLWYVISGAFTLQLLAAFTVYTNPLFAHLEAKMAELGGHTATYPQLPNLWNYVMRGTMVLLILATALVLPYFGDIIGILGGSTAAIIGLVLPCVFRVIATRTLDLPLSRGMQGLWIFIAVVGGAAGLLAAGLSAKDMIIKIVYGEEQVATFPVCPAGVEL